VCGPGAPSPVVSAAAAVGYWEQFEEDEDIAEEQSESNRRRIGRVWDACASKWRKRS